MLTTVRMSNTKGEDIGFVISFIQEVELHACLWNYSLKSYSKGDETSLAWKEIATKMEDTGKYLYTMQVKIHFDVAQEQACIYFRYL